ALRGRPEGNAVYEDFTGLWECWVVGLLQWLGPSQRGSMIEVSFDGGRPCPNLPFRRRPSDGLSRERPPSTSPLRNLSSLLWTVLPKRTPLHRSRRSLSRATHGLPNSKPGSETLRAEPDDIPQGLSSTIVGKRFT